VKERSEAFRLGRDRIPREVNCNGSSDEPNRGPRDTKHPDWDHEGNVEGDSPEGHGRSNCSSLEGGLDDTSTDEEALNETNNSPFIGVDERMPSEERRNNNSSGLRVPRSFITKDILVDDPAEPEEDDKQRVGQIDQHEDAWHQCRCNRNFPTTEHNSVGSIAGAQRRVERKVVIVEEGISVGAEQEGVEGLGRWVSGDVIV